MENKDNFTREVYEAPAIEIMEVKTEQGVQLSPEDDENDLGGGNGGGPGGF